MIIIITYKNSEVEKIESNKLRIVGQSSAYIGEEEKQIRLGQINYIEVVEGEK